MAVNARPQAPVVADVPTAADTFPDTPQPLATGAWLPQVSALRYRADLVNSDVAALGRDVFRMSLSERTARAALQGVQSLLTDLADRGMSWTLLARALGVSIPAIRKWRMGEPASPENRRALAQLVALLDMLAEQFLVQDPVSWIEIPLGDSRHTISDYYARGSIDPILDYAGSWTATPEAFLDQVEPGWRGNLAKREFETYVASDGEPSIRRRTPPD